MQKAKSKNAGFAPRSRPAGAGRFSQTTHPPPTLQARLLPTRPIYTLQTPNNNSTGTYCSGSFRPDCHRGSSCWYIPVPRVVNRHFTCVAYAPRPKSSIPPTSCRCSGGRPVSFSPTSIGLFQQAAITTGNTRDQRPADYARIILYTTAARVACSWNRQSALPDFGPSFSQ